LNSIDFARKPGHYTIGRYWIAIVISFRWTDHIAIDKIIRPFKLTFEIERVRLGRPSLVTYCPPGIPDGSRGEWGVFLKASMAAFCWFEGQVYLKRGCLEVSVDPLLFSSRWSCRFGCDTLLSGCQWRVIEEDKEGFKVWQIALKKVAY